MHNMARVPIPSEDIFSTTVSGQPKSEILVQLQARLLVGGRGLPAIALYNPERRTYQFLHPEGYLPILAMKQTPEEHEPDCRRATQTWPATLWRTSSAHSRRCSNQNALSHGAAVCVRDLLGLRWGCAVRRAAQHCTIMISTMLGEWTRA